jgi:hypothetical protein
MHVNSIRKTKRTTAVVMALATTMALSGCSGGAAAGGGSDGTSTTVANIVGKVSTSASSSFSTKSSAKGFLGKIEQAISAFTASGLTGCTATAYDLNGSTALGSGSVASDGTFTIESSSLSAGSSYKIVTTCSGGTSLSAVIAADTVAPATKTPSSVDPLTTLVTTQIVSAIVTAVSTATSGLPAAAQEAIKAALLKPEVLNNIITTVTTAVKSAVEYGTMEAPSLAAASSMSAAIATATDSNTSALTTAENAYINDGGTNARQIPPTISDTVAGAAKSAAALPACDSSLAAQQDGSGNPLASISLCTQAIAKLIFNDVHFGIAIRKSGGAFGTVSDCSSNNASLTAAFKNAKFTDGDTDSPDKIPSGVCVIESALPSLDRNRSYDQQGEGDHGGMVFFETFSGNEGLITNLATALYNGLSYTLSDLDSIVFSYDATKGGLNARLVYQEASYNWSGNSGSMSKAYYLLQTSGGVNSLASFTWPTCGGGGGYPCYPGSSETFPSGLNADWTLQSGTTNASLAQAIRNSAFTGSVFLKKFGGPIPEANKLISSFADETTHADHNRSGQSKFYVLYAKQPDWNNPNCQWGSASGTSYTIPGTSTTTTKCTAVDGTEEPAVRVNATFTTPDSTTKLTQIASITKSSTGRYYLFPQFNGKFTGLFQLVDSTTGRIILDERMNQRAVVVIMNSSECNNSTTHTPSSGNGCAAGKMYNAKITWSCSGSNSPCSVSYALGTSTAEQTAINTTVPSGQTAYDLSVVYQTNMLWSMTGPGAVGAGRTDGQNFSNGSNSLKAIFVAVNSSTGVITSSVNGSDVGTLPSTFPSGKYAIQQRQNCTQSGGNWTCTPAGYWLVDQSGVPFRASGTLDSSITATQPTPYTSGQADWNNDYCPQGGGTCFTPTVYDDAYFVSLGSSFFSYADSGTGGWRAVAQQPMIFSGPAANPNYNCALDPFFLDGSGSGTADGKINSATNPTTGQVTCLETTFNNSWEAAQYKQAHSSATIAMNHDNAFVYGDPASVTALLQKAFGPMLDGKHTLAADTRLNALQAFGLLYVLMSTHSDEGTYIDGILPDANNRPRNTFEIVTPVCDGDGGAISCNAGLGKGFVGYHR